MDSNFHSLSIQMADSLLPVRETVGLDHPQWTLANLHCSTQILFNKITMLECLLACSSSVPHLLFQKNSIIIDIF